MSLADADRAAVERDEPGVGVGAERGVGGGNGQRVQVDGVHGRFIPLANYSQEMPRAPVRGAGGNRGARGARIVPEFRCSA